MTSYAGRELRLAGLTPVIAALGGCFAMPPAAPPVPPDSETPWCHFMAADNDAVLVASQERPPSAADQPSRPGYGGRPTRPRPSEAQRLTGLDDLRTDRGWMDILGPDDVVIGQVPVRIALVSDNGPCFRGEVFAAVTTDEDGEKTAQGSAKPSDRSSEVGGDSISARPQPFIPTT